MIFPITELLDEQESMVWVENHFHPKGLQCPGCGAARQAAREFRKPKRGFVDYRCRHCHRTYNLYTGTLFAGSNLAPHRVVVLIRGIGKGDPATGVAEELAYRIADAGLVIVCREANVHAGPGKRLVSEISGRHEEPMHDEQHHEQDDEVGQCHREKCPVQGDEPHLIRQRCQKPQD